MGTTVIRMVRVTCAVLAVLYLAAALTIALVELPAPAIGGTCGPGTASESALAAFFDPVSIGAGPEPSAASGERPQWQDFVNACQSSANTRVTTSGGILVAALLVGLGLPWTVRRLVKAGQPVHGGLAPAGWYPDPTDASVTRWWDGTAWGPTHVLPGQQAATSSIQ